MAGRKLARTMLVGGEVFPKGTDETDDLAKAVPNPDHWEGGKSSDGAPKKAAAKAPSTTE